MAPIEPVETMLESIAGGDADVILQAGRELGALTAGPIGVEGFSHYVIPAGYKMITVDDEARWDWPSRKKGTVVVHETASLVGYVAPHLESCTRFYVNIDALEIVAVCNDHDADKPGWGDHRCVLKLRHTPGWTRWVGNSGRLMSQGAFAELVESGLSEINEPDGATVLEIAQSLHATSSAKFRSGLRLQDGRVQFSYVEEIDTRAGDNGDLTIPATITLLLAPFFGASAVEIDARLRYRIKGGDLEIGIVIHNAVEIMQLALAGEADVIARDTELVPLWGTPRPPAG